MSEVCHLEDSRVGIEHSIHSIIHDKNKSTEHNEELILELRNKYPLYTEGEIVRRLDMCCLEKLNDLDLKEKLIESEKELQNIKDRLNILEQDYKRLTLN